MKNLAGFLLLLILAGASSYPGNPDLNYDYNEKDYEDDSVSEDGGEKATVPENLPEFANVDTNIVVKEGDPFEIDCKTNPPSNLPTIFERITGRRILIFVGDSKLQAGSDFINENSTFMVERARRYHTSKYQCSYQANNQKVTKDFSVTVHYPPKISVKKELLEQRVTKDSTVTFSCQATGVPEPEITWTKEDGKLPTGAKSEKGISLILENVDRHEEGTYRCTADNGIGDPAYATMKLMVEYAPEIYTEKGIIRTDENDRVQLICIVHARPTATVTWSKDGTALTMTANVEEMDMGHRHSIEIFPITRENFGEYECSASNNLGMTIETINLTDLPKEPIFTSDATGAEENMYTLTWNTESYYPISEYTIRYRSLANESAEYKDVHMVINDDEEEESVETEGLIHKFKYTLNDLEAATDYEAIVNVKNTEHWGKENTFKFSTKKETADQHTSGGNFASVNMIILLASLSLLFKS